MHNQRVTNQIVSTKPRKNVFQNARFIYCNFRSTAMFALIKTSQFFLEITVKSLERKVSNSNRHCLQLHCIYCQINSVFLITHSFYMYPALLRSIRTNS
jgi:hypothetical protein